MIRLILGPHFIRGTIEAEGNCEAVWTAWSVYVTSNISDRMNRPVEVDQVDFYDEDDPIDSIIGCVSSEESHRVRDALRRLWDGFCAIHESWPK